MVDTLIAWLEVGLLVGLLYAPISIGLSWAFRFMNYPDLTCEGSFMISGAICISILNKTGNIFLSVICGILAAGIAGCFTAFLHVYLKVSRLLSGIVAWAILYSLSVRVLSGLSNMSANKPTIFNKFNAQSSSVNELLIAAFIVALTTCIAMFAGASRWGRVTRAFGDQPWFCVGLGLSPKMITIVGLAITNALVGIGGILVCHFRGVFDINMGSGILISGLAALVIGEAVSNSKHVWQHFLAVIIGTIIYNLAIGVFYFDWGIGLEKVFYPSDVRLVSGLMLLVPAVIVARKRNRYKLFASEW